MLRSARLLVLLSLLCAGNLCIASYPELQLGLGGIARYGQARFANALYMAPEWVTNFAAGWNWHTLYPPQLDSNGYPRYFGNNKEIVAQPLYDARPEERTNLCVGRFSLIWEGEADIRCGGTLVSGSTSGLVVDGRREYTIADGAGDKMQVKIYAMNTNNPPRKIRFWLPDPSDRMNKSLAPLPGQSERIFHPQYLEVVRPFKLVRFMDWLATNNNNQKNWGDHRPATYFSMDGDIRRNMTPGVAWEFCVALANEADVDMWICLPHQCDDDYVTNVARLILYGSDGVNPYQSYQSNPTYPPLSTNRRVFVEYSNEVWNYGFSQWGYANARSGLTGSGAAYYAAFRASQIWKIFQGVWGADQTQRIVRVGAARSSDTSYSRPFLVEAISNGVPAHFLSIAPYFGNGIQDWVYAKGSNFFYNRSLANIDLTHDEWQRRIMAQQPGASTMNDDTGGGISIVSRNLALQFGLKLVNYEGGPSIYTDSIDNGVNPLGAALTSFMNDCNRYPRMVETYRINMNLCKAKGLTTHAAFVDISTWGKYGQWGHKEHTCQSTNLYAYGHAVKYKFMIDWMAEQASIHSIDDPAGTVPSFVTPAYLPPVEIGRPCANDIVAAGGDGARTLSVIGKLLPSSMTVAAVPGDADRLRLSGTATNEMTGGQGTIFARVLDGDGDPAWRIFTFNVVGGNGTIVESDFIGPSPALRVPWTNFFVRAPGFAYSGWNRGSGIAAAGESNAFTYSQNMPSTQSSLAYAISNSQYLTFTITPPAGATVDLRGAQVQFTISRAAGHAPRDYALFTSSGGFADGAQVFDTGYFNDSSLMPFSCRLPETGAYQSITGTIEFRLYGYAGQYAGHKTSLCAFKLKAKYVTFTQRPVAIVDTASVSSNGFVTIDVLANDADWSGQALTVLSATTPAHGSAMVTNNAIAYAPVWGFIGTDSFSYTIVNSGGAGDSASVAVTVVPEPALLAGLALLGAMSSDTFVRLQSTSHGN